MDAPRTPSPAASEREHLSRAHDELCTALTVLRSNVDLVRIELRGAPLPGNGIPVHAHLDELDGAVERLRGMAHELKRWHDGLPADGKDGKQGSGGPHRPLA